MAYCYSKGNTLSEYVIIISLIAVASFAALQLLGNSVTGHYDKISHGNSGSTIQKMSTLDFSSPKPNGGNFAITLSPEGTNLGLTGSGNSGVNATSLDGIRETHIGRVIGSANHLKLMADNITDPALKALLQESADISLRLSTSEAAVEVMKANNSDGVMGDLVRAGGLKVLTMRDSVNSVDAYRAELEGKLAQLKSMSSSDPEELIQAQQLLNEAITSSWEEYGEIIEATDTQNATTYKLDITKVKAVAASAQVSGGLADTVAVDASADAGLSLDNP